MQTTCHDNTAAIPQLSTGPTKMKSYQEIEDFEFALAVAQGDLFALLDVICTAENAVGARNRVYEYTERLLQMESVFRTPAVYKQVANLLMSLIRRRSANQHGCLVCESALQALTSTSWDKWNTTHEPVLHGLRGTRHCCNQCSSLLSDILEPLELESEAWLQSRRLAISRCGRGDATGATES